MTATLRGPTALGWDNPNHASRTPALVDVDEGVAASPMDEDYWAALPDPLPVRDLATIFKIHEATVLRRLQDGTIPGHHIGGSWIVFKSEVRAWLITRRNTPIDLVLDPDPLVDLPDELGMPELVTFFGKTKQTIRAWLRAGTIPGYFLNGRWTAYKAELRDTLDDTSNQETTE
jgi:predicted DNA-binding transcriptional regulator AlpA